MRRYLALLPLFLLVAACGSDGPSSQGTAAAEFWFTSLPEMVAASDVAILGTVVDVRDGTTEGPPGEEIQHLDTVIEVDEAFYGSIATSSVTVQTLKFVAPEREWREVGATVLAFLELSPDPEARGRYYVMNGQSVYLVVGNHVQPAVVGDRLSEEIASMSVDEIRDAVLAAASAIEAGETAPQPLES